MRRHPLKYAKGVPYGYAFNREAPMALPKSWRRWYQHNRLGFQYWWRKYQEEGK